MKFYSPEECRRKACQHWEMSGLASQDNDPIDAAKHTKSAQFWDSHANSGGWSSDQMRAEV